MRFSAGLAAFALAAGLAAATTHAQTRPLLTEEAVTAPAGTLRFESGLEAIANEPSYLTGRDRFRWDGPVLRASDSPSDRVELDLEWVARVGVSGERGVAAASDWGDVSMRAKLRFTDRGPGRTSVSARFGVTLPETSFNDVGGVPLGLGPNTLRVFVQGLLTKPLGRAALHLNAGVLVHDEVFRPHEQRDFVTYGLALTVAASGTIEALAEVGGRMGEGAPGAEPRSEARAGLRVGRGAVRGDFAVRRGLAPADGTWGASIGVTWTLRPRTVPGSTAPGT